MTANVDAEHRALARMAVIAGFASVAAYPLAVRFPMASIVFLAMPLALATSGRLSQQRALERGAVGLLAVLVVAVVGVVPRLLDLVVITAPVAVMWFVFHALARVDRRAARIWVVATASAHGLAIFVTNASPHVAISAVAVLALPGVLAPLVRLQSSWQRADPASTD